MLHAFVAMGGTADTSTNKSFCLTFCVNILFVLKHVNLVGQLVWSDDLSSCDGEVKAPRV